MEKNSLFAFSKIDLNLAKTSPETVLSPETVHIPVNEGKNYIEAYKNSPINLFGAVKGFYLNSTIINAIKNTPDVESLFLYLAKRNVQPTGYTIVSILASKNASGNDVLMTDKIYEWHDPINMHTPINENEIGY